MTNISTPSDELVTYLPETQTTPSRAHSPEPSGRSLLQLGPLAYFQYHREDRLMGAFAGLTPLPSPREQRTPGGMTAPTTPYTTQDEFFLKVGAWAGEETSRN